jgi:hypothetical protein
LQVGAGRGEVRVPQLARDQRQRDPLAQQFDSVRMAELVLVPTSAQASLSRPARCAELEKKCAEHRAHVGLDRHNADTCHRPSRSAPLERSACQGRANYVAVDVLSSSGEQIAATNVWRLAEMMETLLTIDGAHLLGLRS